MSEQVWNFPAIDAAVGTLRGHAATINGQHEELSGLLSQGAATWSGEASTQWTVEQGRLNSRYADFFTAVTDYINAVESAKESQQQQEATNQASFA